jgi:hypothetical protein
MVKLAPSSTSPIARGTALGVLVCALALGGPAAAAESAQAQRTVVLAFVPAGESELAGVPGLSVGIMSATQGRYERAQLLLDITQGARVASPAYPTGRPPALSVRTAGGRGEILGWRAARTRADAAPQLLQPGLLAASVPGGAGYAGIVAADDLDAAVAADRQGHIAAVSLGSPATLSARTDALERSRMLVVADLPGGAQGAADLRTLSAERAGGELLIVIQRYADAPGGELLWAAAAGLAGGGGRELSSATTNQRGLIAAVDIAPSALAHLGVPVDAAMRGEPIRTDGALHSASLRRLMARLRVIGPRRLRALGLLLCAWALLLLAARTESARACALRIGALAFMWAPVAVLIPAALEPGALVEYVAIGLACLGLATLTDALLPWPRAPIVPALAAVVMLIVDALAGTQLLVRSLLGPNPILGARFYGIGNELKSGLAVLVLAALAAALYPAARGGRMAAVIATAGAALAFVEGSARVGAGVGGVILVSAGFALAAVMMLPGALTRRRLLTVLIAPAVALVALAGLDLATAHGGGHFTGSVLHARSASDLRDLLVRRYTAAWDELKNHAMPVATAFALLSAGFALRRRERLLAPVGGDPAWSAALAGGLTAGVVGALVEDSGPVLLLVALFALGCVSAYLWGEHPTVRLLGHDSLG